MEEEMKKHLLAAVLAGTVATLAVNRRSKFDPSFGVQILDAK
jgi:hypothetical protein